MWSNLKQSGYKSMKLIKGIVIAVTIDASKIPAVSFITDSVLEDTISSHMAGMPVDGLQYVVLGGFSAAHRAEIRGNGTEWDGVGRAHLVLGEGCPDVASEGLFQVAFTEPWGEQFLAEQPFMVCFSFADITGQGNADSDSRWTLWDFEYEGGGGVLG
jgi:hypothetical protein